ncbi:hypothetical protein EMCRGX_G030725 [Ephydatia muelleri]
MSTQMLDWHPSKVLGTNVYQQPVKLWDLRAGLSACKMCPCGAHPHLAVFWPCPQTTVMCMKWKLADKHAARDHLIRHQRRCQQPQDEVRPYMDVYLIDWINSKIHNQGIPQWTFEYDPCPGQCEGTVVKSQHFGW